ncbi:MAG: SMI1/KNR4 family protein [Verrucomicrobiaceae bacterium]|nr:MAG: SMI1/KNR4 family protein [Verrucomicrobiaceae bacterium]
MKDGTLDLLGSLFGEFPILVSGPAPAQELLRIEEYAGFDLPADYRIFVERYGGAIVGPYSIYGFGASHAMGNDESSVITTTEHFRSQKWPGTEGGLVISMDHAGNPITLDMNGCVWLHDHDFGSTEKLADSFEDYLMRNLGK